MFIILFLHDNVHVAYAAFQARPFDLYHTLMLQKLLG